MISKAATLLLLGATIVSGQFMPRLLRPTPYDLSVMADLRSSGCPPAPALAPVICRFMQPNLGLHYKPPLIAPSTYIPPLVVEKCDTPHIEIELPAKKPIVIPEAPILPPITIPKFPVPVIVEKPLPPPMPIVEPCETALITDGSAISIPVAPAFPAPIRVPQFSVPMIVERPMPPSVPISEPCESALISGASAVSIPAAPALPPLEMPALPAIFEQHGTFMSGAVINDIDIGYGYQSMVVPHTPELPALVMPEVPVRVEPPMIVEPCPEDLTVPVEHMRPLAPVPAAPMLPPVRLPEIPVRVEIPASAPPMFIERPIEEPCITGEFVVPHPAPVIVPQPPRLPQPMPILPAPVLAADPCEPSIKTAIKMVEYPYFDRSPYIPMPAIDPGFIPARFLVKEKIPRVSAQHFKPMQNVVLLPSPHMRHV